jgi:hypothetical protein
MNGLPRRLYAVYGIGLLSARGRTVGAMSAGMYHAQNMCGTVVGGVTLRLADMSRRCGRGDHSVYTGSGGSSADSIRDALSAVGAMRYAVAVPHRDAACTYKGSAYVLGPEVSEDPGLDERYIVGGTRVSRW